MKKKFALFLSALMLLSLALTGCGKSKETIHIASKPMTEQFILTEMLSLLIEQDLDVNVEITKGVGGGTGNIQPAMEKGDFDLYPEYTSTAWQFVLKETEQLDDDALFARIQEQYREKYHFEWVGMYGFSDTYGLAMRKDLADQHNIKTCSDLAQYTDELTFGAEPDYYEREDGYDALISTYGYQFKATKDIDIGLKYDAIQNKQLDVMNIFTTDARLANTDITVLEDDKKFFPSAYCGTVVRQDILEKYPGLKETLQKMENLLTNEEMAQLNLQVEVNKKDEREVAKEFLKQKGLLK